MYAVRFQNSSGTHQLILSVARDAGYALILPWMPVPVSMITLTQVVSGTSTVVARAAIGREIPDLKHLALTVDGMQAKVYFRGRLLMAGTLSAAMTIDKIELQGGTKDTLLSEMLLMPRVASQEDIAMWHNLRAPFYDPSPHIPAEHQPVTVKGAGADIEMDKYGIRATRKADGKKTFEIDAETGDAFFRGDITGASGEFANGKVRIGDLSGKPWGDGELAPGTAGIWGDQAGIWLRGYARLLRWGYAEDEDVIDLSGFSFLANPDVILAPKEMITYLPQQPTAVPRIYTEVVQLSPTELKVKAKTYIRGGVQPLPTTGNQVSGSWRQPSTIGLDGKRGVYTNHFTCRVGWFASGGHRIRVTQYVTNEFNSNGDPINWVQKRTFSHQGPLFSAHSGTLNWDLSLDDDVWAIRVDWTGYRAPAGIIYAQASITKADYRTDAYLDINGNPIGPEEPSGMGVMYIAYDQG